MSLVIAQPALGDEVERVADALTQAFTQMREGVLSGEPVVVVLDDRDLLGQGGIADAAVACGMLGLVRAFALEGAREGWIVNALTHTAGAPDLGDLIERLSDGGGLTGQLIRCGTDHLGRLWP